jgi:hypothetical protein
LKTSVSYKKTPALFQTKTFFYRRIIEKLISCVNEVSLSSTWHRPPSFFIEIAA